MPAGRPKKHLTDKAKAEAKRKYNKQQYLRKKSRAVQCETRPDFIHYAPEPPGVPSATPLSLGLRISANVPVPRDPLIQPDKDEDGAIRPLSPLAQLPEDDVEAARVISQLKASDKQHTTDRDAYKRRIQ
jgi:hypothetical protein